MADITEIKLPDATVFTVKDPNAQPKTLTTPLTINGNTETTVEDALDGLNDYSDALKDNLAANENVYGAKNLLENTGVTETAHGVTFTTNDDGSVSTNGKCTRTDNFAYHTINNVSNPKAGTYLLTGAPPTGTYATYALTATLIKSDNSTESFIDYGSGVVVTIPSGAKSIYFTIRCYYNVVVDGLTFYPMLRDARILDPTFAPYAKTNLQLTDDKAERNDLSTIHATGSTNTTGAQIDAGSFFYLNGRYCKALTNIAANATFTLNTNFEVASVGAEISSIKNYCPFTNGSLAPSSSTSITVPDGTYLITTYQGGVTSAFSCLFVAFVSSHSNDACSATALVDVYHNITVTATKDTITIANLDSTYSVTTNVVKISA